MSVRHSPWGLRYYSCSRCGSAARLRPKSRPKQRKPPLKGNQFPGTCLGSQLRRKQRRNPPARRNLLQAWEPLRSATQAPFPRRTDQKKRQPANLPPDLCRARVQVRVQRRASRARSRQSRRVRRSRLQVAHPRQQSPSHPVVKARKRARPVTPPIIAEWPRSREALVPLPTAIWALKSMRLGSDRTFTLEADGKRSMLRLLAARTGIGTGRGAAVP
jgi:hypothetical protein